MTSMDRSSFFFGLVIFCLFSGSCGRDNLNPISASIPADRKLAIELVVSELQELLEWKSNMERRYDSTNYFMFTNGLVVDLYKNPYSHYPLLIEKISDTNLGIDLKVIWIQLSQCISDEDYLLLIDKVLSSSLDEGDKGVLVRTLLSPGLEWGTKFDEKFSEPLFMSSLEQIRQYPNLTEFVDSAISRIVSGKNASFLSAHRGIDGEYPRISCAK